MKQKGIKQDAFYNDTGIHIGRILSLDRDIRTSTLGKIAKYLDVDINDLTN